MVRLDGWKRGRNDGNDDDEHQERTSISSKEYNIASYEPHIEVLVVNDAKSGSVGRRLNSIFFFCFVLCTDIYSLSGSAVHCSSLCTPHSLQTVRGDVDSDDDVV